MQGISTLETIGGKISIEFRDKKSKSEFFLTKKEANALIQKLKTTLRQ